jgi:hypothetical protein
MTVQKIQKSISIMEYKIKNEKKEQINKNKRNKKNKKK